MIYCIDTKIRKGGGFIIKVIRAIAVLLIFTLVGIEVNAQTDPRVTEVAVPLDGDDV